MDLSNNSFVYHHLSAAGDLTRELRIVVKTFKKYEVYLLAGCETFQVRYAHNLPENSKKTTTYHS